MLVVRGNVHQVHVRLDEHPPLEPIISEELDTSSIVRRSVHAWAEVEVIVQVGEQSNVIWQV